MPAFLPGIDPALWNFGHRHAAGTIGREMPSFSLFWFRIGDCFRPMRSSRSGIYLWRTANRADQGTSWLVRNNGSDFDLDARRILDQAADFYRGHGRIVTSEDLTVDDA